MKIHIVYCLLVVVILLVSCSKKHITKENNNVIVVCDSVDDNNKNTITTQNKNNVNLDSVRQKIFALKEKFHLSVLDTIKYQFSLEDVGTEGNEGSAYYLNDSIKKIEFNIYTSMWMYHLLYLFDKTYIKVTEQTYNIYEDIKLVKDFSYTMDLNGVPLKKLDSDRIDIFGEFKQVVPFVLRN